MKKKVGKYVFMNDILGEGNQGVCKKACLEED